MPTLPWMKRKDATGDGDYVVMASRLPLLRYRRMPGFLRSGSAIRRQLASAEG